MPSADPFSVAITDILANIRGCAAISTAADTRGRPQNSAGAASRGRGQQGLGSALCRSGKSQSGARPIDCEQAAGAGQRYERRLEPVAAEADVRAIWFGRLEKLEQAALRLAHADAA